MSSGYVRIAVSLFHRQQRRRSKKATMLVSTLGASTHFHRLCSVGSLSSSLHFILSFVGGAAFILTAVATTAPAALAMSMMVPPDGSTQRPTSDATRTATTSRTIRVVVWSDLACPWCYVGQKRLAQGIEMFQSEQRKTQATKVDVQVEWKPYMIDPGTDVGGEDVDAYCRRRWGGSGWTHHLRQEGSKSGATFRNWRWWCHTGLAHQWVQYGKTRHGASTDRMNSILFEALYESGQNLSSLEVLIDLARKNFPDWNVDEVRTYLVNNQGWDAVQEEIQAGRGRHRVSSVPYFVIGTDPSKNDGARPYGLSGAQSAETFCEIFRELSESDAR